MTCLKTSSARVCSLRKVPCPRPCGLERKATERTEHGGTAGGPGERCRRGWDWTRPRNPGPRALANRPRPVSQRGMGTPGQPTAFTCPHGQKVQPSTRTSGTPRAGGCENSTGKALRLHSHPSAGCTPEPQAGFTDAAVSDMQQPSSPSFSVSLKVPFPQTIEMR